MEQQASGADPYWGKKCMFDQPLALAAVQSMLSGSRHADDFHLPKIDWVQPTLEFCRRPSPNFCCSSQR
jgi:hypothetical protein